MVTLLSMLSNFTIAVLIGNLPKTVKEGKSSGFLALTARKLSPHLLCSIDCLFRVRRDQLDLKSPTISFMTNIVTIFSLH